MTNLRLFFSMALVLVLLGCAGSRQVAHAPKYEADLYPVSETKAGITIGIDEIRQPERAERYFGADLLKEGIVPVSVVVSNYGKQRVVVKPSDILVHRAKNVIDPLPIASLRSRMGKELGRSIENAAFTETVLSPNESYRGVLFFATPVPKRTVDRLLSAFSALREGGPKIRVGVTNLDSGERVVFGPFLLTFTDSAALFSFTSY
jgi:hypothetical protein